jgi:23S rRNA (uracil1939-C5)-methyltransferase
MKKNDIEPYQLRRHSGSVRYAAMRHSKRYNELMVIAVMARAEATIGELVDGLDKIEAVKSVYMCVNDAVADVSTAGRITLMSGQEHIKENINGIDYLVGPDSFFQTNPYCCDRLYGVIKERTKGVGGTALDMCCGSGGITLQVAGNFDKVIGVDISAKNIENALLNARINKRDNVEFVCQDAEKFVPGENLSTIILDPPRAGLGKKAKKWVLESGVENVVYVSCNPVNLAQDLTALKEAYKIKSLIPVDMFPHTRHLEVVAILKRDKV